jgi:chromate transporter
VKTPVLGVLGFAAIAAVVSGVHELVVLAACGLVMVVISSTSRSGDRSAAAALVGGCQIAGGGSVAALSGSVSVASVPFSLSSMFLIFVKIGAVLFGSGYVLLAFLRADFVDRLGWLTEQQLLDAVALGQVTPGPVFTTATFIGYVLGGPAGGLVATVGIFLPAFVFVALSGPLVPMLRRSKAAGAMLDGVNIGSLALMSVVSWQLGRTAIVDPLTVGLALASWFALVKYRVNSALLIALGAAVGVVVTW